MTITEILTEIHKQRVELEICQELQRWLLDDRASWIDRAMDAESTVRAIGKIAKENKNKSSAIDGIVNICDSAIEDWFNGSLGGAIMRINEINNRINELETSIEILKAIRQDFVENNKEEIFIKALNDGINYTTQRLDKYKTTDWIMAID